MNPRPKKNEEDKRTFPITIYCTKEEKEEIESLARKYGYAKNTDFIRRACLGYEQVDRTKLEK
jgi:hypothetical protein